jgi:hypothetical protein
MSLFFVLQGVLGKQYETEWQISHNKDYNRPVQTKIKFITQH